jgi:uncharacterized repeat protein (TIGR01451 family)
VATLNLKSGLFKFIILLTLIFILIPVATAIDCDNEDVALDDTPQDEYSITDTDDAVSKHDEEPIDLTQDFQLEDKQTTGPTNGNDNLDRAGKLKVKSSADLVLTKTAKVSKVKKGGIIVWTIKVTNRGPDRAENVEVTDRVSGDVEFFKYYASRGDFNPLDGIWAIGGLDAGESVYLKIYAKTLSDAPTVNRATAVSETADPDFDNNYDSSPVEVEKPSLKHHKSLAKTISPKLYATGNPIIFLLLSLVSICGIALRKQ